MPGVVVTREDSDWRAWLNGEYVTLRLFALVEGVRVHTNARGFPERPGSAAAGKWMAIGGLQAEDVSGPPLVFKQLRGKYWHDRAGRT